MKKTITIYELLGKVKDNKDTDIYVKYMNRMTEKEDKMWTCVENIIDKLDNKVIYLDDEVEILDEEGFEDIKSFGIHYSWDYIDYKNIEELKKYVNKDFQNIFDTLDKLIKNQKKIIEKLNKNNLGGK